ncbi:cache domain-containing protein [Amphritea sp.]|uniref:sensor domain-containing diguanylate cyclase n=1 Tax=Amphritea sp. TaxID=1872502 RepID=UPI003D0C3096
MDFTKKVGNSGLFSFWVLIAISLFLLTGLFGSYIHYTQQAYRTNLEKLQTSFQLQTNRRLQTEVANAVRFIDSRYRRAEQIIMARSQNEVTQALAVMESLYQQNRDRLPEDELKKQLVDALREIRFFNGRGYLFVGDETGKSILLPPFPELEGTSMADLKDDRGTYFVRRFLQVIRSEEGRGYVRYRWYPPSDRSEMRDKITFIARFEPFNWLVGAGDYIFQIQNDLQQEIIEHLQSIQFGQGGYLSIIDRNGQVIAGRGVKRLVGQQVSQMVDQGDRGRIIALLNKAKTEGYIRTDWYQADGLPVENQLVYAAPLPVWDWIVVAGGDVEPSLGEVLNQRELIIKEQSDSNLKLALLVAVLVLTVMALMRYFARGLGGVFTDYQNNLNQQQITLSENARSLEISQRIVDAAHEGIMITDANNRIMRINNSFTRITGYVLDDVKGKNPSMLKSSAHDFDFYKELWESLKEDGEWHGEVWNLRKNGTLYPQALSITCYRNEKGEVENYIGTFTDISDRKAFEKQLEHLAQSDSLTDLPNRRSLSARLQHELTVLKRYPERQIGVVFMDLDFFKQINDTHGHGVGDQVLIVIAQRLRETVRAIDMVSRVGGDEFVILLGNQSGDIKQTAIQLSERVLKVVAEPMTVAGESLVLTASLGIAFAPTDTRDDNRLMEYADLALYQAKQEGRNTFKCFAQWMAGEQSH